MIQEPTISNVQKLPKWTAGAFIGASVYYLVIGVVLIAASANPITPESLQAMCHGQESGARHYPVFLDIAMALPGYLILDQLCSFALNFANRDYLLLNGPAESVIRDFGPYVLSGLIPSSIGAMLMSSRRSWRIVGAILAVLAILSVVVISFSIFFLYYAASCVILD